MRSPSRTVIVGELSAMTVLILSYIWLWQRSFSPGDFILCVLLYVAIGASSHFRRGETPAEIGFRFDNLGRATLLVLLLIGPLIVITIGIGIGLGSLRPTLNEGWPVGILSKIAWGTLQQYGLLAFFFRRLQELLRDERRAMFAAAAFFAIFHLPNPFLILVTWAAGTISCWLYRRVKNIWVIGVAHGLLGIALARSLPVEITMGMRIGPGYFRLLERLQDGALLS
jgi:hypothetical protein